MEFGEPVARERLPPAPGHLAPATRRWWRRVVRTWTLSEHHIRLLTLLCEAWDRGQEARAVIAREGLTAPTRDGGVKLHPAARLESDSRIAFARLLRELDL